MDAFKLANELVLRCGDCLGVLSVITSILVSEGWRGESQSQREIWRSPPADFEDEGRAHKPKEAGKGKNTQGTNSVGILISAQ